MGRPSKRLIRSREARAIGAKRRRLAEAEAEAVFPDEVEDEGEDDEAEEDDEAGENTAHKPRNAVGPNHRKIARDLAILNTHSP